ncbi:sugar transferase [Methylomicrobium sp. Wu6]|uniref:sugar transferase n=1 Tax=Methylomicrobium sp. Wu6 TaxID=3107928 RepID=UPI002DD62B74|nr:sugar transferase [Methylomicrobium sp. Wu6]MEC4749603.1 sugar transferase [Methylomicrobium sp. Wu6]
MKNTNCEHFQGESAISPFIPNSSSHYRDNYGEIIYDSFFIDQLRLEKLRAQRSKTTLSIVLLTLDEEAEDKSTDMVEILNFVRSKIRATDISGFVNHKTIGILLPDTNDKGAKEICAKLINGNKKPQFSATASSYPDDIFESLEKKGGIGPDVFPFDLEASKSTPWFKLLLKRSIDIVGSIVGIVMLMPLMLITALAIKVTSPGPVIFRQIRLGKQGNPFTFYKFRSMRVNMDDRIHREYIQDFIKGDLAKINQGNAEEPLFKIKSDPRVTRIGSFIRKTSIDELPQFFNVLMGDMSLVGPRPPLPYEAEKYQAWHLRRILEMKPGITGLWQVEGRSTTEWDDSVRLDIRYIQNWSILMDLKILLKTVKVVFKCRGAV